MDWENNDLTMDKVTSFWQEIGRGKIIMSPDDMEHLCGCTPCQQAFLETLRHYPLKITPEMMAAITASDFKQEVVKALCLRVLNATVTN